MNVTDVFSSVLWLLDAMRVVRSVWALASNLLPVRFSETVSASSHEH